ncbi:MAG: hypothetical protein A3I78_01610 [Gammaproteobacteria bacterium RIFCSPLOWO2_02_FULL_56_15]|nr:MAG: hypothetical protein A3I78_01610 [Gammaproteobacteria bacterium RIFCSPLOWO2_02_FULL_56_15]
MKNISSAKEERIELRVSSEFKTLFSRAAEISGVSLNAFVLESVRERAMNIIDQHERIVLNNQARDMLINAISNRSAPGKALRRAASRFAIR